MNKKKYSEKIMCPTLKDFADSYPQYAPFAKNEGKNLFELLVSPKVIIKAKMASEFEFPAVFGVANICCKHLKAEILDSFTKQFIGAVVCCTMEANGYEKTGQKRSVKHPSFSKGEFYKFA